MNKLNLRMIAKTKKEIKAELLAAKWLKAFERKTALYVEFDQPTVIRDRESEAKFLRELKAAGEECHKLFLALKVSELKN